MLSLTKFTSHAFSLRELMDYLFHQKKIFLEEDMGTKDSAEKGNSQDKGEGASLDDS